MKAYLVVFFVLLSFVGFGQDSISDKCFLRFCTPEGGLSYNYHFYEHFQDFFPSDKMINSQIKTIEIIENNIDNNEILYRYKLDENGFIKSYHITKNNFDIQIFYTRDGKKILKRGRLPILSKDTIWTYYTYSTSSMQMHYAPIGQHVLGTTELLFDTKNRVSTFATHLRHSHDTTHYIYDEINYKLINIVPNSKDTTITQILFNKDWQPIREISQRGSLITFEGNFIYQNNQLIKHDFFTLRPKPIDLTKTLKPRDYNDINTYEKEYHKTTFHYNAKGLLEKIIQTTNEGTCEYRVYYYTE